jgi:hypothetical protein
LVGIKGAEVVVAIFEVVPDDEGDEQQFDLLGMVDAFVVDGTVEELFVAEDSFVDGDEGVGGVSVGMFIQPGGNADVFEVPEEEVDAVEEGFHGKE